MLFLVLVQLRTQVLCTRSSTRLEFKLMTSISWQYISCHWDACSNNRAISDLKEIYCHIILNVWGDFKCTGSQIDCILIYQGVHCCTNVCNLHVLRTVRVVIQPESSGWIDWCTGNWYFWFKYTGTMIHVHKSSALIWRSRVRIRWSSRWVQMTCVMHHVECSKAAQ